MVFTIAYAKSSFHFNLRESVHNSAHSHPQRRIDSLDRLHSPNYTNHQND
jgi:hypothetical protein